MPTTQDELGARRQTALATPSDLGIEAVNNITGALNALLADVVCSLRKDLELSLARQRTALSGLPPVAR
jgi:hypothetical protein